MTRTTASVVPALIVTIFAVMASSAVAQSWTELTPSPGPAPSARRNASAILDPVGNRMIVFGGFSTVYLNDIWAFDLGTHTWADLTPPSGTAPAVRLFPASVYDPYGHQMVTWSGQGPGVFYNDVWAFDLDTNTWSQYSPAGGPPNIRYGVGYTWDPQARELVTFAGFTNLGRFDDVWRFNDQSDTWSDVSPALNPLERCLHVACYDAVAHRMIMYGGQNGGPLDDLWALDLDTNSWTDITPASNIPGRFFATAVYDAANRRMTVFGGQTPGKVNEAWVFDLWTGAWTLLAPAGTPPSARYGSASIYDGNNDRMVIFGGFDTAVNNDVWSLNNLSGTSTGVPAHPAVATLRPVYPNPFNPTATITFEMTARANAVLRVYNASGRAVRTLFDGRADAGTTSLTWNGRDDHGHTVASGIYFCRLNTASATQTRKMVLLK